MAADQLPKMRIVQGTAWTVETMLLELLNDYAAVTWNFAVVKDELLVTVVLIAQAELRKQALANIGGPRQ